MRESGTHAVEYTTVLSSAEEQKDAGMEERLAIERGSPGDGRKRTRLSASSDRETTTGSHDMGSEPLAELEECGTPRQRLRLLNVAESLAKCTASSASD